MCLTDATLMVFLITAQLCLLQFYLRGFSWKWFWLMAVAIGFGGLTKGPVVFVPPAATLLVLGVMDWKKWLPYVRPVNLAKWAGIAVLTVVIALAVCAPWLIVLQIREPQWIAGVLGTAAQHITQPLDNHRGPFGYYLLLMWGTFFPWSLLVPFAACVAWKQRKEPYTRFAIAAAIGPWLFFEMMKTKLPHYPLPTYPFLGLLIADALVRTSTRQYLTLFKSWIVALVGVWAIPVGLGASAPWLALLAKPELLPLPYVPMTVVSLAGMACTIGTFWFFYRRRPLMACAYMGGSFIVLIGLLYGWLIPQCQYLRTSEKVVAILRENGGTAAQGAKVGDVLTLAYQIGDEDFGYSEPTLFFYQGGTMRPMDSDKYLEATPIEKWPKLVVITDGIMNRLPTELQQKIEVLGRVRGFAYSAGGRIVDVMVIRAKAGAQ
jgi:4-amino-4-deoxy-L-arabinose transferase-like glycosyltransferase